MGWNWIVHISEAQADWQAPLATARVLHDAAARLRLIEGVRGRSACQGCFARKTLADAGELNRSHRQTPVFIPSDPKQFSSSVLKCDFVIGFGPPTDS